jgi:hypothetical protein
MECWNNGIVVKAVWSYFFQFGWKVGKYLSGQNIKGSGVLPYPELFKTLIDFFQCDATLRPNVPVFHLSIIPIVSKTN